MSMMLKIWRIFTEAFKKKEQQDSTRRLVHMKQKDGEKVQSLKQVLVPAWAQTGSNMITWPILLPFYLLSTHEQSQQVAKNNKRFPGGKNFKQQK